jgi:hypothetical protein
LIRQVHRELKVEQLGVQAAHRDGGGPGGDGDPERPEHRAAVTLLDVLPAEVQPQLAATVTVDQIAPGPGHRLGLCRNINDRHQAS